MWIPLTEVTGGKTTVPLTWEAQQKELLLFPLHITIWLRNPLIRKADPVSRTRGTMVEERSRHKPGLCGPCQGWKWYHSRWSPQLWRRRPSCYFLCAHSGCPRWSTATQRRCCRVWLACRSKHPYNGGCSYQRCCSEDLQTLSRYHFLKKRSQYLAKLRSDTEPKLLIS